MTVTRLQNTNPKEFFCQIKWEQQNDQFFNFYALICFKLSCSLPLPHFCILTLEMVIYLITQNCCHVRYINIMTRLWGFQAKIVIFLIVIFFNCLLSLNSQKIPRYKENFTPNVEFWLRLSQYVRILIYQTWPFKWIYRGRYKAQVTGHCFGLSQYRYNNNDLWPVFCTCRIYIVFFVQTFMTSWIKIKTWDIGTQTLKTTNSYMLSWEKNLPWVGTIKYLFR